MATAASEQWCQQACPSWPSCAVASFVRKLVMPAGLHNPVAFCLLCTGGCVVVSCSSHALNCCSLLQVQCMGGGESAAPTNRFKQQGSAATVQ
jgi:hypothetical protein